jgi:TonB-dependent receptor
MLALVFTITVSGQNLALAQGMGTIAGRVSIPAQGEYVRSAEIRIEGMQAVANSDANGSYRLYNVPAGRATLTVTYTGYEPVSVSVLVIRGQTLTQNFDLRSAELTALADHTVKMDVFTVSTGREGQAKAIMEQKAAMTATNVIAADSFGSLAEGNVAELLQYLPGVEVNPDGAISSSVSIRGMGPEYGGLTVDGMAALGTAIGTGRAPSYGRTNLNAIDLVELNKTVSADMDASAPAGTVNLKSKSAFQRKGRFIAWQVYATGTSADMHFRKTYGADNGRHRKVVPGGSLEYSELFLDGKLGLMASIASTTTYLPHRQVSTTYDRTPTTARPAPMVVSQLTFTDIPVFRSVLNNGLSLDYKLGESTVLSLRGQAQITEQAFYSRNIALIATRAVQGAGANGTTMNVAASSTGANNPRMTMSAGATAREMATWMIKPSLVYTGRNIELEVALAYSLFTHEYIQKQPTDGLGNGQVTSVTATLFPVGWTASRNVSSSTAWNVNQISGPDFRVLENWQASASTSNVNRSVNDVERERFIGQLNLRYRPNWGLPTFFKTGIKSDEHIYRLNAGSYAYTFVGPTGDRTRAVIPVGGNTLDLNPGRYGTLFSSSIHVRDVAAMEDLLNQHPEYFVPAATNATNATNLFPDRYVRERIDSAYVMANTQWNKWMFQAGVRTEHTRHVYRVYERSVAERRIGKYEGVFLSGAAKYRFRPDLIATFGFSQSVRRPDYGNLTGVAAINDNLLTGDIPNPLLKPEWGSNYSTRLEYYFEPAGNIAVGVFQSDIADLIYQRTRVPAEEIGLGGEYPGYLFTSWGNRDASFRIQGFELEYRQQLVFLPGALRGIGVFGNYTRTRNSDPSYQFNIAPGTASAGLNFRHRKLNVGLRASWTDEKLFSATDYVKSRAMVGLSFDYRMTERTAFSVTGRDLLKSPIQRYDRQLPDHQTFDYRFATQWTIGVNGTF